MMRASGQPLAAAYESRSGFIVHLPDILLHRMWAHTAKEVYGQRSERDAIIGKIPRSGHTCSPAVGGGPPGDSHTGIAVGTYVYPVAAMSLGKASLAIQHTWM